MEKDEIRDVILLGSLDLLKGWTSCNGLLRQNQHNICYQIKVNGYRSQ